MAEVYPIGAEDSGGDADKGIYGVKVAVDCGCYHTFDVKGVVGPNAFTVAYLFKPIFYVGTT